MPAVFKRIQQFNHNRIPEYASLKYQLMTENAFRFFRGTCHLFYEDLARHSDWKDNTRAWICGDLHLENFGSYKAANGVVYFDLNDFDEAIQAPASWELSRLLTSIYTGAEPGGYNSGTAEKLAQKALEIYRQTLAHGKALSVEKQTASGLLKYFLEQVKQRKEEAFVKSRAVIGKKEGHLLIDHKKTYPVTEAQRKELAEVLTRWFRKNRPDKKVEVYDAAYRVAGTGSVGLHRYVLLLKSGSKWHLLDMKQANPSSLQPYVKIKQPAWESQAQRIVTLQDRIQQVVPRMLETIRYRHADFVLKVLQPTQDRMDLTLCKGHLPELEEIIGTMARLTASGHLRSSGRQGSSIADELIAFARDQKKWPGKVMDYAREYAVQVQSDFASYTGDYRRYQKQAAKS